MSAASRDRLVALGLGAAALTLYVVCLPPSYAFWDTGELQTVAAILGIAHPPACPAFVLLGWLVVHAIPFGEPAWRVDLLCASAVAGSAAVLYVAARRFEVPPLTAALVTLGFATASVPWRDATRAEVQDLALLLRVLALAFALRYVRDGRARDVFLVALFTGLAGATHGITLLLLPALAACVMRRPEARSLRTAALGAGGLALGLAPYAYLPLRSATIAAAHLDPTLVLGLAPGAQPFWDYDHPATWGNFVRVISGADFHVRSGFTGFVDVGSYPRFAAALIARLSGAYGYAGTLLAALGAGFLLARKEAAAVALVVAALLPVPYTEAYRDLQDPDRYYLLTLWCAAIAIGVGLEKLSDLVAGGARRAGRFIVAGILVASLVASSDERGTFFAQRYDRGAPNYVAAIVAGTPETAVVVAEWAYATPLAYAAYVDHRMGHRIVISAAPAQFAAHYPAWLAQRPLYIVSFDDDLHLRGFAVEPLGIATYYAYRVTLPSAKAAR